MLEDVSLLEVDLDLAGEAPGVQALLVVGSRVFEEEAHLQLVGILLQERIQERVSAGVRVLAGVEQEHLDSDVNLAVLSSELPKVSVS